MTMSPDRVPSRWAPRSVAARWVAARVPDFDAERVHRRADLESPRPGEIPFELQLARRYRERQQVIGAVTSVVFVAGIVATWGFGARAFVELGGTSSALAVVIALVGGLFVHGAFAFVVHEATHHNLFGRRSDRALSNVALGLMLMPFAAETYQVLHLHHHQRTGEADDPNWTPVKAWFWRRARWLYALYEATPLVNSIERLWAKPNPKLKRDRRLVVLAWIVAIGTWFLFRPSFAFFLVVQLGVNLGNAWRLWIEHFGHYQGRAANTYWFPLTFGAGHHALHHDHPGVPAWILALGLVLRAHDVVWWQAPFRVLFDRDYRPFRETVLLGSAE